MDEQKADGDDPERRFYDRISGVYDLISDASERKYRERGLELLAASTGERVLEIGYGTGHCLVALGHAVGSDGRVDGVDISEGMQTVAADRLESEGLDNVFPTTARCPPLPYDDHVFDVVFSSFTLEIFEDGERDFLLEEIDRVLAPNGRLGVVSMALPRPDETASPLERTYQWLHRHFPHIVDCAPIDLEKVLEDAGFKAVRSERGQMFTMPVAMAVASPA